MTWKPEDDAEGLLGSDIVEVYVVVDIVLGSVKGN